MLANATDNSLIESLFTDPTTGARRVTLRAGEEIYDGDSHRSEVMYIHSGEVRMFQIGSNDSVHLAAILGPGDWIGAAAVAGVPYSGKGVAAVASEVSILQVDQLMSLLQERPAVAVELFKQTATRLMNAYSTTAGLMFEDCNERLIKTLISLSDSPAAMRDGSNVTVRITHQQLAQAVGAARETISLALTELRHQQLLETGRNRLIFDPNQLAEFRGRTKPHKSQASVDREPVAMS